VPAPCSVDRHYKHMLSLLAHTLFWQTLLFQFAAATTCMIHFASFSYVPPYPSKCLSGFSWVVHTLFLLWIGTKYPGIALLVLVLLICYCQVYVSSLMASVMETTRCGQGERRRSGLFCLLVLLQFVSGEEGFLLVNILIVIPVTSFYCLPAPSRLMRDSSYRHGPSADK